MHFGFVDRLTQNEAFAALERARQIGVESVGHRTKLPTW